MVVPSTDSLMQDCPSSIVLFLQKCLDCVGIVASGKIDQKCHHLGFLCSCRTVQGRISVVVPHEEALYCLAADEARAIFDQIFLDAIGGHNMEKSVAGNGDPVQERQPEKCFLVVRRLLDS
jgi:hypothetical protein